MLENPHFLKLILCYCAKSCNTEWPHSLRRGNCTNETKDHLYLASHGTRGGFLWSFYHMSLIVWRSVHLKQCFSPPSAVQSWHYQQNLFIHIDLGDRHIIFSLSWNQTRVQKSTYNYLQRILHQVAGIPKQPLYCWQLTTSAWSLKINHWIH